MNHLQILNALKRELKSRDLTYATISQRIQMSEASVKRMLASVSTGLDVGLVGMGNQASTAAWRNR